MAIIMEVGEIYIPAGVVKELKNIGCDLQNPTIYDVATWFRKNHKMHLCVDYECSQLWSWTMKRCSVDRDDYIDSDSMFSNFETALLDGIINAIKRVQFQIKLINSQTDLFRNL